ncbi:MAG: class I SAM-dependent methyltransferase [Thermoanaerobaculia bacterium]|nr:class I SAM-dependent methyltransferase [Thermoanaerobaculia bacterium]
MLRALIRRLVPGPVRAGLRRAVADARYRRQDFAADLRQRFTGASGLPLPPAALRHRVGPNSSRAEFLHVGALCAGDLLQVYRQLARPPASDLRWLDFGCGCGRVARHLLGPEAEARFAVRDLAYTGVDVDRRQIAWAARHLPGTFAVIPMSPPTALPGAAFDVIFTISVFTHLDEGPQEAWLGELARLLRPGGLLLATTHAPDIARSSPGVTPGELAKLEARGFLFRPSVGPFNEQSTFHSEAYLRASWSRHLELRGFFPKALGGFQDISAWEKREPV